MSENKWYRRTRQTAKESVERQTIESMAEEMPPGWAQELLKQSAELKESVEQ